MQKVPVSNFQKKDRIPLHETIQLVRILLCKVFEVFISMRKMVLMNSSFDSVSVQCKRAYNTAVDAKYYTNKETKKWVIV